MFYELKKFYTNLAVIIMLAFIILVAILLPVFFMSEHETYSYRDGAVVKNTGLAGYSMGKTQTDKVKGSLDEKKLNQVLALYKSFDDDMESYKNVEEKYPGLSGYLIKAYAPYGEEEGFLIKTISNADDFGRRDIVQIKNKILRSGQEDFFRASLPQIERKVSEIKKPYVIEFVGQWPILIASLTFTYAAIAVFSLLISSRMCSFEKEQKMDLILSSIHKKQRIGIGYKKILAMVIYISAVFAVCTIIVSSIVFLPLGISGWNTQVQNLPELFTSLSHWSIGEMYMFLIAMAWVGIIGVSLIGFFVNAVFQQTYTSMIITAVLVFPPWLLYSSEGLPLWLQKVFLIQPINGTQIFRHMRSLFVYDIGLGELLSYTVFFVEAVLCILALVLLSPRLFARRLR